MNFDVIIHVPRIKRSITNYIFVVVRPVVGALVLDPTVKKSASVAQKTQLITTFNFTSVLRRRDDTIVLKNAYPSPKSVKLPLQLV